jgi:hypothetical protein
MNYIDAGQLTLLATADLSGVTAGLNGANPLNTPNPSGQYLLMKLDTANPNQVVVASSATDAVIGVLMNAPVATDNAVVRLRNASGTMPVMAGGTITAGDRVTCNASGQVITTTTSGNEVVGIAKYSAATGQIVEVIPFTGKY